MSAATAGFFLALSFGADELGTEAMLRAGGREQMIRRPAIRWAIKGAVLPVYLHEQKKSRAIRFGLPVVFFAAGAWNIRVARQMRNQ